MANESWKPIGSFTCKQYQTEARFYIDEAHVSGHRRLIVEYGDSYQGPEPRFHAAAIPDDWSEQDVLDLIFWPMNDPNAHYPAWEMPARAYGNSTLFRWWAGGKPSDVKR
jgi:hypothetical protein